MENQAVWLQHNYFAFFCVLPKYISVNKRYMLAIHVNFQHSVYYRCLLLLSSRLDVGAYGKTTNCPACQAPRL